MNERRDTSGTRRVAGFILLGGLILGGSFVTAAAMSGNGSNDPAPSAPTGSPAATPASTGQPIAPAQSPTPTQTADPGETPSATPPPADGGGDAMPITVPLDNATGNAVSVDIVDLSGNLLHAVSGTPGDGASVAPYTLRVENVDEGTLRLTWVDYPIDNALALYIDGSGLRFVMVQPEPTSGTDAIAFDRALILTFADPVSAADVEAALQGGLDTPGE